MSIDFYFELEYTADSKFPKQRGIMESHRPCYNPLDEAPKHYPVKGNAISYSVIHEPLDENTKIGRALLDYDSKVEAWKFTCVAVNPVGYPFVVDSTVTIENVLHMMGFACLFASFTKPPKTIIYAVKSHSPIQDRRRLDHRYKSLIDIIDKMVECKTKSFGAWCSTSLTHTQHEALKNKIYIKNLVRGWSKKTKKNVALNLEPLELQNKYETTATNTTPHDLWHIDLAFNDCLVFNIIRRYPGLKHTADTISSLVLEVFEYYVMQKDVEAILIRLGSNFGIKIIAEAGQIPWFEFDPTLYNKHRLVRGEDYHENMKYIESHPTSKKTKILKKRMSSTVAIFKKYRNQWISCRELLRLKRCNSRNINVYYSTRLKLNRYVEKGFLVKHRNLYLLPPKPIKTAPPIGEKVGRIVPITPLEYKVLDILREYILNDPRKVLFCESGGGCDLEHQPEKYRGVSPSIFYSTLVALRTQDIVQNSNGQIWFIGNNVIEITSRDVNLSCQRSNEITQKTTHITATWLPIPDECVLMCEDDEYFRPAIVIRACAADEEIYKLRNTTNVIHLNLRYLKRSQCLKNGELVDHRHKKITNDYPIDKLILCPPNLLEQCSHIFDELKSLIPLPLEKSDKDVVRDLNKTIEPILRIEDDQQYLNDEFKDRIEDRVLKILEAHPNRWLTLDEIQQYPIANNIISSIRAVLMELENDFNTGVIRLVNTRYFMVDPVLRSLSADMAQVFSYFLKRKNVEYHLLEELYDNVSADKNQINKMLHALLKDERTKPYLSIVNEDVSKPLVKIYFDEDKYNKDRKYNPIRQSLALDAPEVNTQINLMANEDIIINIMYNEYISSGRNDFSSEEILAIIENKYLSKFNFSVVLEKLYNVEKDLDYLYEHKIVIDRKKKYDKERFKNPPPEETSISSFWNIYQDYKDIERESKKKRYGLTTEFLDVYQGEKIVKLYYSEKGSISYFKNGY